MQRHPGPAFLAHRIERQRHVDALAEIVVGEAIAAAIGVRFGVAHQNRERRAEQIPHRLAVEADRPDPDRDHRLGGVAVVAKPSEVTRAPLPGRYVAVVERIRRVAEVSPAGIQQQVDILARLRRGDRISDRRLFSRMTRHGEEDVFTTYLFRRPVTEHLDEQSVAKVIYEVRAMYGDTHHSTPLLRPHANCPAFSPQPLKRR